MYWRDWEEGSPPKQEVCLTYTIILFFNSIVCRHRSNLALISSARSVAACDVPKKKPL